MKAPNAIDQAVAATAQDPRWAAVLARDAGRDGGFCYSVQTAGVYCRLSCGARTPRPENVQFHASTAPRRKYPWGAAIRPVSVNVERAT